MGGVREKTVDKQEKTCIIVFVRRNTAGLCKGSTADSDSVCEGSNPSPAAKGNHRKCIAFGGFSCFYRVFGVEKLNIIF